MRKIIVMGSVGAGVLLVLAMLTTVVNAQTEKMDEKKLNVFQQIKEKIENESTSDWFPGYYIALIITLLGEFLIILIGQILFYIHDILNP